MKITVEIKTARDYQREADARRVEHLDTANIIHQGVTLILHYIESLTSKKKEKEV